MPVAFWPPFSIFEVGWLFAMTCFGVERMFVIRWLARANPGATIEGKIMQTSKVVKLGAVIAVFLLAGLSLTNLAEAASQEQIIHAFQSNGDGEFPTPDLLADAAGNLYGTTAGGGAYRLGTVFELSPSGGGWTEQILYSFQGGSDGDTPSSGLIADASGNLYGETLDGANLAGTVFELSLSEGGWTKTTLYSFVGPTTGMNPYGGLALDGNGNLYGTTQSGGVPADLGTVFELSPAGGGNWTEKVIFAFGNKRDGGDPVAGPILAPDGRLFGTTSAGYGAAGTIYELIAEPHGKWREVVLHRFTQGKDGGNPSGRLLLDAAGNLYGTAQLGGSTKNQTDCSFGCGTVYELTPKGTGFRFSVICSFEGGQDGEQPDGTLVMGSTGVLYGTTDEGGGNGCESGYGCGTVFELSSQAQGDQTVWSEAVLHRFIENGVDGINPQGGLIPDAQGNWYGTTIGGGSSGNGTVFELTP